MIPDTALDDLFGWYSSIPQLDQSIGLVCENVL